MKNLKINIVKIFRNRIFVFPDLEITVADTAATGAITVLVTVADSVADLAILVLIVVDSIEDGKIILFS